MRLLCVCCCCYRRRQEFVALYTAMVYFQGEHGEHSRL